MDRLLLMRAFTEVVAAGGFSKAADKLEVSAQLVSKYVAQLEDHLGTRLLTRTTRRVSVTEVGQAYYLQCLQVLQEVEAMEANVQALQSKVTGTLKLNAPMSFGVLHLNEALLTFKQVHHELKINLQLNDRRVDLVEDGFDVALRIGHLSSSNLIAKKLASIRLIACAAPGYLKEYGIPKSPRDLGSHRYLKYSNAADDLYFSSNKKNKIQVEKPQLEFESNNGDILLGAAKKNLGFIIQPSFIVGDAIRKGELVSILEPYEPEPMGLYAMYAHRQYLMPKVRVFIDFLSEYFGGTPYWDKSI